MVGAKWDPLLATCQDVHQVPGCDSQRCLGLWHMLVRIDCPTPGLRPASLESYRGPQPALQGPWEYIDPDFACFLGASLGKGSLDNPIFSYNTRNSDHQLPISCLVS